MKNTLSRLSPVFVLSLAVLGWGCSHSAPQPERVSEDAELQEIQANQQKFMNTIQQSIQQSAKDEMKSSSSQASAVRANKVSWTCTAVGKSGKHYSRKNKDILQAKLSAEKNCSAKKDAACRVNECKPNSI